MGGFDILLQTPAVKLTLSEQPPAAEQQDASGGDWPPDAISFIEAGALALAPARLASDGAWLVKPGMLFAAPRCSVLTCRSAEASAARRCLTLVFTASAVDALREVGLPDLTLAAIRATPRQRFLRRRLRNLALGTSSDAAYSALRLELLAGALFESVVTSLSPGAAQEPEVPNPVVRRIAEAADFIDAELSRPLKLAEIARVSNMSTFHFARTFARVAGVPPHRYLVAARLREAIRRMDAGDSVTSTCYAVGFCLRATSPRHSGATWGSCRRR